MVDDLIPPPIDYEAVPPGLEGKWILVKVDTQLGSQQIISIGDSVRDVTRDQPRGAEYLLTRVPLKYSVLVVGDDDSR